MHACSGPEEMRTLYFWNESLDRYGSEVVQGWLAHVHLSTLITSGGVRAEQTHTYILEPRAFLSFREPIWAFFLYISQFRAPLQSHFQRAKSRPNLTQHLKSLARGAWPSSVKRREKWNLIVRSHGIIIIWISIPVWWWRWSHLARSASAKPHKSSHLNSSVLCLSTVPSSFNDNTIAVFRSCILSWVP